MKKTGFAVILALYVIYAGVFIFNTSFNIEGKRYFVLIDDAMISMQYAKNLAAGNGLVWSIGEKVEGFTNPLWTIYMAVPHLLKIPLNLTALFIQLTAFAFMMAILFYVRKIVLILSDNYAAALAATALTAFFIPMNFWFYQGMEVSALSFMMTLIAYLVLAGKSDNLIFTLCGIATLIRIDMAVFFILIIFIRRQNYKKGLLFFLAFFFLQTSIRYLYYGEFLPNTYFLKVYKFPVAERIFKGIVTLVKNLYYMNWLAFILPFFLLKKGRPFYFLLSIPAAQMAYSVYVGGDAWEAMGGTNRYITVAMPVFFCLFSIALWEIVGLLKGVDRLKNIIFALLTALFLFNFNCLHGTRSLKNFIGPVDEIALTRTRTEQGLYLKKNASDSDRIAVFAAGIPPYFSEKKYFIDFLGKNDKYIARLPVMKFPTAFDLILALPGHMKFDYNYSINTLKPDYIVVLGVLPIASSSYVKGKFSVTGRSDIFKLIESK